MVTFKMKIKYWKYKNKIHNHDISPDNHNAVNTIHPNAVQTYFFIDGVCFVVIYVAIDRMRICLSENDVTLINIVL